MVIKGRRRDYTEKEWRQIVRDGLRSLAPGRSASAEIENILAIQEVRDESKPDARKLAVEEQARLAQESK